MHRVMWRFCIRMNRDKTYYFILNVNAGARRGKNIWKSTLKPVLLRYGVHYRAYVCTYAGHATVLTRQVLEEQRGEVTLVVVGGDGTFNEVLNGITDFDRVTLGFIPTGSANDLGFAMGISSDPKQALLHILRCKRLVRMDVGRTVFHRDGSSRYFAISSGVGLDAEACRYSHGGRVKNTLNRLHLGMLTYLVNTVRIVFTQPLGTAKLIFSDARGRERIYKVHGLYFLAGMNQPCEGGHLMMAPLASARDGKLSFAMAHGLGRVQALVSLALLVLQWHKYIPGYEVVNARRCHVMLADNFEVHTDGENFGRHWDITIECLPKKLQMICGSEAVG